MSEKPSRGRPAKTLNNDARGLLIDKTLDALRIRPDLDVQRQVLAAHAGFTPALVNYYFPEKWDLIYLAVSPVLRAYGDELSLIVDIKDPDLNSLRAMIRLYVKFNMQDDLLLDYYLESLRRLKKDEEFLHFIAIYKLAIGLIDRIMARGVIKRANPVMVQSSLWGLSRYAAQRFETIPNFLSNEYSQDVDGLSRLVFDMLIGGAASCLASEAGPTE